MDKSHEKAQETRRRNEEARAAKWRITPSTVRACLRSDSLSLY